MVYITQAMDDVSDISPSSAGPAVPARAPVAADTRPFSQQAIEWIKSNWIWMIVYVIVAIFVILIIPLLIKLMIMDVKWRATSIFDAWGDLFSGDPGKKLSQPYPYTPRY